MHDDSTSLWGSIKAAAGAAGGRPSTASANVSGLGTLAASWCTLDSVKFRSRVGAKWLWCAHSMCCQCCVFGAMCWVFSPPNPMSEQTCNCCVTAVQGFNQNDAALRFLQGQRTLQGGGNTAVADASQLYTNAADLLSKAGMTGEHSVLAGSLVSLFDVAGSTLSPDTSARVGSQAASCSVVSVFWMLGAGSDAARLADQWGAQEPDTFAATGAKPLFGGTPRWDPLPQRDALGRGSGGHGGMLGGCGDAAADGGGKDAGSGGVTGAPELKPPSPLDAFRLPAELEAGGGFGGMPPAGSDGLSAATVGGFADAAAQPFTL